MSKKALVNISHGSGAEFMSISFARALTDKYDEIYISSVNKYFTDALAQENSKFVSIGMNELPSLFHTIMTDREDWVVLNNEVYQESQFVLRLDNYYASLARKWNIEEPEFNDQGSVYTPHLEAPEQLKQAAKKFSQEHKKFVLFQRQGGINPVVPHNERLAQLSRPEQGLKRSYPIDKSEKLVELLAKDGYEVVQYCLPEEPHVKGTIYLNQEQSQLFYHELSKYAKGVITIDSSLLHLSVHNNDNVVVIWNQTQTDKDKCIGFGYQKCKNLYSKTDNTTPYFNGIPASPYIEYVEPEEIYRAFNEPKRQDKVSKKQ